MKEIDASSPPAFTRGVAERKRGRGECEHFRIRPKDVYFNYLLQLPQSKIQDF